MIKRLLALGLLLLWTSSVFGDDIEARTDGAPSDLPMQASANHLKNCSGSGLWDETEDISKPRKDSTESKKVGKPEATQ